MGLTCKYRYMLIVFVLVVAERSSASQSAYLTKVRELLESHPDAATFAAQLKAAYPTLPGAEGVNALAQALCK